MRDGYILIEALCALAVVGLGLLPVTTVGPVALRSLQEHQAIGRAVRIASEAAELASLDPTALPLALEPVPVQQPLRICDAAPGDVDSGSCLPGNRLAIVGPLPQPARGQSPDRTPARSLRMIALWLKP